ncbi:uncharacterized protein V1478_016923 [Vespula squamosa]|uniref:Uncharacterized protein n=1 Tax=Vespula squamosa TaxID=30214 RepID=A0ABD2A0J3_VESSQ
MLSVNMVDSHSVTLTQFQRIKNLLHLLFSKETFASELYACISMLTILLPYSRFPMIFKESNVLIINKRKNDQQHKFGNEFISHVGYIPAHIQSIMSTRHRRCIYASDISRQIICYTEKSFFINSQGFKIENNLFVLKEFGTCDMKENLVANYIFLPSFNEGQLSRKDKIGVRYYIPWLTDNHHGLEWNDGFINYNLKYNIFELHLIPLSGILNIYMKGTERIHLLWKLLPKKMNGYIKHIR